MIGILGGTSFLSAKEFVNGNKETVFTPYGSCEVIHNKKMVTIPRHGTKKYLPPHKINHHAHLKALEKIGVTGIVSFGSVGSLQEDILPGTQMLVSDIYSPNKVVTYCNDRLNYMVPTFDQEWVSKVKKAMSDNGISLGEDGTYAETNGPRFESVAEIKALSKVADIVGMTCASEVVLAMELKIPIVVLATVDNWANGISSNPLTESLFKELVEVNKAKALKALAAVTTLA